ncbi:MAG TPA: class I SAM-dependent methyltransferase [Pyrinomonadaceae bacterium]|jgi:SAM-dependent methyltransferase|nr:class I SAM-dependent methyltransferase [Pyrinomonadaceae bacterium]
MNFFAPKTAADRYAKGRPFFHPPLVARIGELISTNEPFPRALDVGCGTGLSTLALKQLAREIVGVDVSAEMLSHAPKDAGLSFCLASAERLPFGEQAFDLLTICQAFHWLDRGKFLAEARRVVKEGGWLVVYDNYFTARMEGRGPFGEWHRGPYLQRFPVPPRGALSFTPEEAGREGFELRAEERFENSYGFTKDELVDFLLTHSNVIAAVEGRGDDLEEVRRWLDGGVAPFFEGGGRERFLFDAPIWCLRRA